MTVNALSSLRAAWMLAACTALSGHAAPGAHGPNGEHLDGPVAAAEAADASPRMEARSEQFELVATLGGGELSILIDRFETNEPVLNAQVEVESGPGKATARFDADHGDYAVDDPAFLKLLEQPGEHPVVVTVIAAKDSDLLEGTLRVTAQSLQAAHGRAHAPAADHGAFDARDPWVKRGALALAAVAALAVAGWRWRRRARGIASQEALR